MIHMKKLLIFLVLFLPLTYTYSQDILVDTNTIDSTIINDTIEVVLIVDEMENAIIHQDSLVRQLMIDKYLGIQRGQIQVDGFRVQVYSSNQQQIAKNEALMLQQNLENQIDNPIYAISEPPFWKVRIGNFQTREEATEYRNEIISLFPELQGSTYVVPDKVIITN